MLLSSLVWLVLAVRYVSKWIVAREAARAEIMHPVQCCFTGLIGVASMLVAGRVATYSHVAWLVLYLPTVAGRPPSSGFSP